MKMSKALIPTLKEAPNDAVISSHILMMRAGLIRKSSAGLYSWLPMGLKVLHKIENIIRKRMDEAGAQECLLPILLGKDLWETSGRWSVFKREKLLFSAIDRHDNEYALGPTHEEAITDLVVSELNSYRALPINLYQINTKFRDEIRPRYGVMRSKEFIMKDAYSFHETDACLDKTYSLMSDTYKKIFTDLALDFVWVRADSGAMGGSGSEEFMVKSDVGEDEILTCGKCSYAANTETAIEKLSPNVSQPVSSLKAVETVSTPSVKTIADLTDFFKTTPDRFIKSLVYRVTTPAEGEKKAESRFALILIRGDYEVNDVKLGNLFAGQNVELASDAEIKSATGAPIGFVGPFGIKKAEGKPEGFCISKAGVAIEVYADETLTGLDDAITGANEKDLHYKNVSMTRDVPFAKKVSVYTAKEGGQCPECSDKLKMFRGIEVGHVFKLGKKYTSAFQMKVLTADSKSIIPTMGCYGIGVGRSLASIVEQHHDDGGICWPMSVAPYHVHLLTLDVTDAECMGKSEALYKELTDLGVEVLFDDRDERAGFKFKDADLIGIPLQVVLGKRGVTNGLAELKVRKEGGKKEIPLAELKETILTTLKTLR